MKFLASLVLLGVVSVASAQTISLTINTSQTSSISPYIYGINGTIDSSNNLTLTRAGGNRWTAYNWTNNYSNAGSDWYYENDNALCPNGSTAPAAAVASTVQDGMSNNGATLLTIPMVGYVAKDDLGGNADVRYYPGTTTFDPNWLSDRMLPSQAAKPGGPATFSTNTATLQAETTVYQDEYVNYLKTLYPAAFTANSATPIWFDLDNEPDLWTSTHAEARPIVPGSVTTSNPLGTPAPLTYTELLNDTVTYATAVKAVAPNTLIFGPVSYGWNGYTSLQGAPDSGTYGDFLTYYLNQTASASKTAGQRLVDVLDLHWYPEATGAGIRITNQDSGYSGSTLAQLQAARIQAPRSLWDTTYTESSWITGSLGGPIYLIPREQAKMTAAANTYGAAYAANKLSISEYDYGGGDDISGGIAEADVLGVFGANGVFSSAFWPLASNEQFIYGGMAMFRNYDGKGSTFGDISVSVTNPDPTDSSLYASDYSTNSARMTLVAINKDTGNLTLQLPLPKAPNGQAFAQAAIYDLTAANSTPQFVENVVITNPADFSYTMPGYSVTTIALSAGSASVWSAAVSGSWSLAGNWTGGVPNAIGTVAAINASTTAALTITLDKPQTVGLLQLGNSASATVGYTVSGTGTNTLTFNNAGNGATITVTDGTHAINAPVVLADNLQVTGNNSGWTLSFGTASSITGGYGLTMGGNGTLILSGQNTYTGVTTLTSGILNLGSAEHAGTSGPLGESVAANPGSIVFNGGTLQYSASNTNDYSGRFSTAANQAYSVDTNGQNVIWATALTASGGSLAKLGNGTLTLAAADNFAVANVSGGGVAAGGGTIGAFNLNTGAGTSSIGAGAAVTTINVAAGGVAVSGGAIGAFNLNTGAGASTIGAGAAVTTLNVNANGVAVSGGTIGVFNLNTGAGTSTIGAGATVATTTVNAGTVNFNTTRPNGTLTLPAASTGTVIVGPASGGLLPTVGTADFSGTPSTSTVNAANPLAITGTLKLPGGVTATISNGSSFTATGANLASASTPSTLGLSGGTLTFPTGGPSQSIAVHWSGYGSANLTNVSGADGIMLPSGGYNSNWTNVGTGWYSGSAGNLLNSTGGTTTAAVNCQGPSGAGTYWYVDSPQYAIANGGNVDNVVVGPGGGNGAIANAITGIPYTNYEIIAYANDTNGGTNMNMWLDGNPASSNSTNAPRAGTNVYFGATVNSTTGYLTSFVPITNTVAGTYPAGNYTVWTGLSGSSQTLWLQNDGGDNNVGITGFEIVSAAGPASVNLPATAISATSSSTLDFGETAPASNYHTLGGLSLTAGTGGGTQLRLQNGLNINFNGISAIYPAGGSGASTASIAAGSTSPVISLAGGSSVYVDPNVTLTIGLTIGNPQSGATALAKTGSGTLVLSASSTYSGGTTISSGALEAANGSTGSATGSSQVTLNGGTLAAGTAGGSISGLVQAGSGADTIAPGYGLTSGYGTLNLNGGLTTSASTTLSFDLGTTKTGNIYRGDLLKLSGALTVGASTDIVFSTTPGVGDYRLIGISGATLTGSGNFVLPFGQLSTSVDPNYIDLVVQAFSGSGSWVGTTSSWNTGTNWRDANNDIGVPGTVANSGTDTASFSGSGTTAVNLTGIAPNLKSLSFSNSNYTLSNSTLTLQSSGTATVTVSSGTQQINSALALAGKTLVTLNGGSELTLAGNVSGTGLLALAGDNTGRLVLSGSDTYGGSTTISSGALAVGAINALSPSSAVTVSGGTLDASGFPTAVASLNIASGGRLNVGLGNTLASSGTALLQGALNVSGTGTLGNYQLVTYLSESGTFSSVTDPGLGSNYGLVYSSTAFSALHEAQVGTVTVTAANPTVITGGTSGLTVNVANSAPASSDVLNFTASDSGAGYGYSTTGSLTAAASGNFTLPNGFSSSSLAVGSYTGTVTVTGTNGALSGAALGSGGTATVTVNVLGHSNPALSIASGNNQTIISGGTLAAVTLNLTDAGTNLSALDVNTLSNLSGSTGTAVVSNNGTGTYTATGFNTTTVGLNETLATSLYAGDQQGLSGHNALAQQGQNVTYSVLDHAAGSATVTGGDGLLVHAATVLSATVSLSNAAGTRSDLEVASAPTSSGTLGAGPALPYYIPAGSAQAYTAAFTAPGTSGPFSDTVTFPSAGDRQSLSGANPLGTLSVSITGNVYSGEAQWNAMTGTWGASANWTDTVGGGPSAPPGLSGYATDTATFDTAAGSGTATVTLDGAAPVLSNLIFSSSNVSYTISQGIGATALTLTGASSGSPAAVTVISGTHSVETSIMLDSDLVVSSSGNLTLSGSLSDGGLGNSLTLAGGGQLILSGTGSYSGGTYVNAGTMYLTNTSAMPPESNLTVGAGCALIFDPNGPAANVATLAASPAGALEAVPEPGTLALLAAAVCGAAVCQRLRSRSKKY